MSILDYLRNTAVRTLFQSAQNSVAARAAASTATQTAAAAPKEIPMTGPEFDPIAGVSLELYANLLALMSDVGEDRAECLAIAAKNGVGHDAWEAAKAGWTARMEDPALENRVSNAFLKFYGPALHRKRGGVEPMSLEEYVRLFAETSFRKDPNDPSQPIDREVVIRENGLTMAKWNEALVYWSPRVSDAQDPIFRQYQQLLKTHIDRLTRG